MVPVVNDIEQVAALGACDPDLVDTVRGPARRGDAPLKGDIHLGRYANGQCLRKNRAFTVSPSLCRRAKAFKARTTRAAGQGAGLAQSDF